MPHAVLLCRKAQPAPRMDKMNKRSVVAPLVGALTLSGLYRYRRRLLSRLLGLPPALYDVAVERDLRVQMPDEVELVADRYHPSSSGRSSAGRSSVGRFPTVLVRTPYGKQSREKVFVMRLLAERGYNALIQDVRGGLDSGERFSFPAEDTDGRATIDWVSKQAWFDGALGMMGESYLGYTQWAAAPGAPSYLKAIMPSITASRFYQIIYPDGVLGLDVTLPVSVLLGRQRNDSIFWFLRNVLLPFRIRRVFMRLPVFEADVEAARRRLDQFREWVSNPDPDSDYWRERDQRHRLTEVDAHAHLQAGWYDMFLREQLKDYVVLAKAGKNPYLTVGPYPHGSFRGFVDAMQGTLAWFGLHLKGEPDKVRGKPVRLYVTGANEWRDFDAWPPPAVETRYHLHAGGRLSLEVPPTDVPADHYHYDPADPTPAVGGPLMGMSGRRGVVDNRKLESRPDVLLYTTPPLTSDLEVIGPVRLELYAHSSLEHADFFGRVCDVHPDGRSYNVCDGLFRLAPGTENSDGGSPVFAPILIDMWATAHRFSQGHCIRVQVSSGAHPRWNRNLGTGEPIATATTMLAAEQTIYHDSEHPSAVVLPVRPLGPASGNLERGVPR